MDRTRRTRMSGWVFFVMLAVLSLLLALRLAGLDRGEVTSAGMPDMTDSLENCDINTGVQSMSSALKDTDIERVSGDTRTATAAEISKRCFETAENVLLTSGDNYADALAGVPLAYALDAPILLVQRSQPDSSTMYMIERLGAKNIYILGGERAISAECAARFSENGFRVKRIYGADRYETAVRIAEELSKVRGEKCSEVFFASAANYPDALAASAPAALKGTPILYIAADGQLDSATKRFLRDSDITGVKILGGTGAISEDAEKSIGTVTHTAAVRIAGNDRYETNLKINEWYASLLNGKVVCAATGTNYPDALAGGVLAARECAPMLLVDGSKDELSDAQDAFIRKSAPTHIYILGGVNAVSEDIADSLRFKDESGRELYLSIRATALSEDGEPGGMHAVMRVGYDMIRRASVNAAGSVVYSSEGRLPVYDSFSDTAFFAVAPEEDGQDGEALLSYDRRSGQTETLATGFDSIREIIPTDNAVYMLAVMRGADCATPVKLDRGTRELTVFDNTGKWDFELLTYDNYNDRLLGAAAHAGAGEQDGGVYSPPSYALFVFTDDLSAPGILYRTENERFRRVASMPDGSVYMTLENAPSGNGVRSASYTLDAVTGELTEAPGLDELADGVSASVCFSPDGKRMIFTGAYNGSGALYSYEPEKKRLTRVMTTDQYVLEGFCANGK